VQSHDSRRSKMDLIVRVHIDGDLLHHGRPSSRFTLSRRRESEAGSDDDIFDIHGGCSPLPA
jgi:hypothetical protein